MKLVIIPGGDSSDDKALVLAPDSMSNEHIENAVSNVVASGIAVGLELPDMLDVLVSLHGFVLVTDTYTTNVSWVEGS